MKTNIAKAIINMSCMPCRDTLAHYTQLDRAQTLEQAVTEYIKDCFASTVREKTNEGRNKKMASTFSQTVIRHCTSPLSPTEKAGSALSTQLTARFTRHRAPWYPIRQNSSPIFTPKPKTATGK